ncbi:MAG: class I SAM-dependent methyltransferase [Vulcanisaeta sp. AZ3]
MSRTSIFRNIMNRVFAYSRYDLVNNIVTLYLLRKLRYWASMEIIKSMNEHDCIILDLGAGDGSMTKYLLKFSIKPKSIVLLDPAINGLLSINELRQEFIDRVVGVSEALPLRQSSICTIYTAFAFRQFNNKALALIEAHRVLRRNGSFVILEFWRPDGAMAHAVLLYYLTLPLPLLISIVAPRSIRDYLIMRDTIRGIGPITWLKDLINRFIGNVEFFKRYLGIFVIIRARKN